MSSWPRNPEPVSSRRSISSGETTSHRSAERGTSSWSFIPSGTSPTRYDSPTTQSCSVRRRRIWERWDWIPPNDRQMSSIFRSSSERSGASARRGSGRSVSSTGARPRYRTAREAAFANCEAGAVISPSWSYSSQASACQPEPRDFLGPPPFLVSTERRTADATMDVSGVNRWPSSFTKAEPSERWIFPSTSKTGRSTPPVSPRRLMIVSSSSRRAAAVVPFKAARRRGLKSPMRLSLYRRPEADRPPR